MCVFNMLCLAACLLLLSMPTKAQNGALPWGTGTPPAWATTKEGIMSKMMGSDTTSFWTVKAAAEAYLVAHPEEVGDDEESGEFTKKYARWEQFWHRRVGTDGNIPAIKKMMKDFALNYDQICDDNGPWQQLGPIIPTHQASGFISAIYAPKEQSPVNIIYAGSHDGGLWKTVDGGINWVNKTDGLRLPGLGINCIIPSPTSPNTMYIATGNSMGGFHNFGMGILKSDNNGDTWTTTTDLDLSTPPPPNSNNYPFYGQSPALKLVFSLSDPTTLYALCNDRLFKTNDDGVSWIWLDQLSPSGIESFFDIRTVPGMPNALVVASKGTNAKVHLSLDNGNTWTDVTPPHAYGALDSHSDKMCIATSNSKVHVIYPYVASGNNTIRPYKIYDLTAATPQWQLVNANVPGLDLDNNDSVFDVNLTNENIIYAGKVHLKRSINGGLSFQEIYPIEQHDDVRALQIYTSTTSEANDVLLIGNDGGVSKSTSGGNVWEILNGNLVVTEFFDIAVSPARPGVVAGGAQDNSYYKLENGAWINLVSYGAPCAIHNDGGHTLIDWSNPNVVYSRFNADLKKSIDGGNCFSANVSNTSSLGGEFDGLKDFLLAQDLQNPNWLYLAKINNFRKIDASTNTNLSTYNFNTGGYSFMEGGGSHAVQSVSIASIAIAPSNPDIIYLAGRVGYETNKGRGVVFKSIDRGVNWTLVNTTSHNINTIAIDPRNAEHIWVGYGDMDNMEWSDLSSGENRVGVSTNGGTTIDDAISHDNGLTPTAVNTLIYDRSASILYAGTDAGVFWYDAPNNHWACFNAGLPVCVVSDLEIDYCKRLIYAGTFGRGIWVAPLPALPATAEEVITTNTTLPAGSVTNWGSNIRVTPGNTLTVKGLLNMSEDKRIIVQRGAKLIVDGGTITNTCGNRWGGIEVWGNTDVASRHQLYFNAAYTNDNLPPITDYETAPLPLTGPGVVVLKNNALLEYGPLGTIVTQRTDGYYPNHYGGIVVAQDATFLNCKKGVGFMKYRYENYSYFNRCHFISNNNNLPNAKFEGITAWACNGIVVDDCTFDYQTTQNTTNDRFGITTSDNLNLIVRNKCKFSLLNQAISLGAGNYLNGSATITDNLFEYNQIGINNLATSSLTATGNQFTGNSPTHQGISIGGTCGYTITNNTFTNLQAGIAAWFTSHDTPGNNLIDCNTYSNCKFGNYLNDNNIGLQLTDNAFDTQTADNKLDNGVNNGSIAFSQGDLDAPHFNLFSTNPATQHFKAPAGQTDLFVYFYHTDPLYTPAVNARLVPK
ncbi:MAG: hypothetical protein KA783_07410, partial [Chitinophagales bacterium]|nr:hypothetical protein [Chitinophagales bacterium]